jgi:glutamate-1-semialdehyde 2,1-aminomutase
MFTIFFARDPVTDYETAARADTTLYARFFHQMLSQGVYFPPSQFEAAFVSAAHTDGDIQSTVSAAEKAFTSLL